MREPLRQAISTHSESLAERIETCTHINFKAFLSKRRQTEAIGMLSLRLKITLCFASQEMLSLQCGQTAGYGLRSMDTDAHPEPKSG